MSGSGMIFVIQLLVLSLTLLMAYWSLRRRRLYGFMFAGLGAFAGLLLLGLPSLVVEFGYKAVSDSVIIGLVGSICLITTVSVVELMTGGIRTDRSKNPIEDAGLIWPSYVVATGVCILLTLSIAVRHGANLIWGTWEDARASADLLDAMANLLQFFLFPAAWVACRTRHRCLSVLFLIVSLVSFPVFGSRAALLSLPAAIGIDLLRSRLSRGRIYLVVAVIAAGGLFLHIVGRVMRGIGLGGLYQILSGQTNTAQALEEISKTVDWTGGESEVLRYFVYVVNHGAFEGAATLTSVTRWLSMYLPRWLVPETKPEDVTYVLWRHATSDGVFDAYASIDQLLALLRAGESGSIHPTLWGEMWVNGGWLAIPVMSIILAGIIVAIERFFDAAPRLVSVLVGPATVVGYIMVARGNSVIGLGYFFYLVPIAFGMYLMIASVSGAMSWRGRPAE